MHPLWYLAIYFFLIPSFAGLYFLISPDGFYAPYASKESSWVDRQDEATLILGKAIFLRVRANLCDPPGLFVKIGTTWKLHQALGSKRFWALPTRSLFSRYYANCESLALSRSITDGQTIHVTLGIEVKEYQRARLSYNKRDAPLSYFRFDAECTYTERTHPHRGILDCGLIGEKGADLSKPEFRSASQARKWVAAAVSGKFIVWGDEVSTLTDFQNEFVGISTAIGKDIGRMLYLSVVILTTLGLGDIVPVANASRLLVGLEATSGIFIAGLFLNALAWRASQKADQDKGSKRPHVANPQPQPAEGQPQPALKPPEDEGRK
ncbi:two pore domain potassium channel family protein [Rhizobium pisi]|uniref:Two pore domain potassium channel family protein n=1 Tax=Rhizobium pisi TaxID=574561 RepID=A0A427MXB6_9HYPH|nr:two pore domain potassium channel family protein [Rhizobium pisi]